MTISFYHILGIVLSIILIEVVGIMSSKKVKTADDFNRAGGKAGTWVVCGTIMGTLIGGQSTVGTAQLAFTYGISAWWFTLGAALGCVFLAIGYVMPLRKSGCTTLLEVVSKEYGKKAEVLGSVLSSVLNARLTSNKVALSRLTYNAGNPPKRARNQCPTSCKRIRN